MEIFPLLLTLKVAFTSTILAIIIGVPVAWWLARIRFWGHDLLSALVLLPMLLPPSVLGFYLLQMVGRGSAVGTILENLLGFSFVFHWSGAVLASFVVSVPFLIRTAQTGFESISATHLEAARTLGRSEVGIFFTISIPLAWRAILAGTVIAFARAMGEFGATLLVAGNVPEHTQTLSLAIYDAVQANRLGEAQVMALTLTMVTLGLLVTIGMAAGGGRWSWRR